MHSYEFANHALPARHLLAKGCLFSLALLLCLQLYINGPYWVNADDLTLRRNPGSWNRLYGLLYIEQPIGVGFSPKGGLQKEQQLCTAIVACCVVMLHARHDGIRMDVS